MNEREGHTEKLKDWFNVFDAIAGLIDPEADPDGHVTRAGLNALKNVSAVIRMLAVEPPEAGGVLEPAAGGGCASRYLDQRNLESEPSESAAQEMSECVSEATMDTVVPELSTDRQRSQPDASDDEKALIRIRQQWGIAGDFEVDRRRKIGAYFSVDDEVCPFCEDPSCNGNEDEGLSCSNRLPGCGVPSSYSDSEADDDWDDDDD